MQPEVLFAAKGERIRDKGAPPVITASGEEEPAPADRVILVRYLEFPILLRLSKHTHENTSLYVIAGPAFAFRRNAVIRDVADSGRHEDIEGQVNTGDLSVHRRRRPAAQAVDGRRPTSPRRTEHRRRSVSGAGHDTGVLGADGGEVLGASTRSAHPSRMSITASRSGRKTMSPTLILERSRPLRNVANFLVRRIRTGGARSITYARTPASSNLAFVLAIIHQLKETVSGSASKKARRRAESRRRP